MQVKLSEIKLVFFLNFQIFLFLSFVYLGYKICCSIIFSLFIIQLIYLVGESELVPGLSFASSVALIACLSFVALVILVATVVHHHKADSVIITNCQQIIVSGRCCFPNKPEPPRPGSYSLIFCSELQIVDIQKACLLFDQPALQSKCMRSIHRGALSSTRAFVWEHFRVILLGTSILIFFQFRYCSPAPRSGSSVKAVSP
jgi:hypothetical protein